MLPVYNQGSSCDISVSFVVSKHLFVLSYVKLSWLNDLLEFPQFGIDKTFVAGLLRLA